MKRVIVWLSAILLLPGILAAYRLDFSEDGATETGRGDGYVELRGKDGEIIRRYSDRSEARLLDGTQIIRYPDGRREIRAKDGVKISVGFDSSVRYEYPDGRVMDISMDGKTPYGLDVEQRNKTVRRNGASVAIMYSPMLSDDNPDKNMDAFLAELAEGVRLAVDSGSVAEGEYRLVVSNCRFCKTGYCRRKNRREIEVTAWRGEARSGGFVFSHEQIAQEEKRKETARGTIESLKGVWTAENRQN